VVLGIVGIFLPLLPTTPFLLLAAYLFVRSSKSLYRWILTNRITGNYIRNYIHYRAINPWIKVLTLVILWGTISYSIYLTIGSLWIQILLTVIAIGVSIHVINLRNMKKGMPNERNRIL
jgi:uncharacterized membrane protein YbaN (DUF454 family)